MWPFNRKKSNDKASEDQIDINKPITNPGLKQAFKAFNEKKNEANLQTVVSEFKRAKLLVLSYKDTIQTTPAEDSKVVIEPGSVIRFLYTRDEHGQVFLPLFTDWNDVKLWVEINNIAGFIFSIKEGMAVTLHDKGYSGLVINPCSDRWTMTRAQVEQFMKEFF